METLRLSIATHDYDHVRDLLTGAVRAPGIRLVPLHVPPHEAFYRFMTHGEWDVSEMSMGGYCAALSDGTANCVAIPVFPSRVFRQSAVFVRDGGGIDRPEDLAGRRVGVPEWGMTAVIYVRGWLMHQVGIPLSDIAWVQAGMNEAGRTEKISLHLPAGVSVEPVAERSLNDLLLAGDIDAIITAAPPDSFRAGDGRVRRLFPDFQPVELDYFRQTGIHPIMHTIAIRNDVYERDPWVARSLYTGFEEAKRRSVARVLSHGTQVPIPWSGCIARQWGGELFGDGEYWPYGIEPNRVTLDAFLQFCHEQGVCGRRLAPGDLFARELLTTARE